MSDHAELIAEATHAAEALYYTTDPREIERTRCAAQDILIKLRNALKRADADTAALVARVREVEGQLEEAKDDVEFWRNSYGDCYAAWDRARQQKAPDHE